MKRMKDISRISFLLVLILVGLVAFSSTTHAANFKPYEYTFEVSKDATDKANKSFSGIMGVKNLVITFDSASIATSIMNGSNITVIKAPAKGDSSAATPLTIVDNANINLAGNIATIPFKNLEYIDYSGINGVDYQLIIEKNGVEYIFPFAIHDVLPGFKSVFLDLNADEINEIIFSQNAPREISVYIPKYYLTKIETIHRNEGIVNDPNVVGTAASLTNIDVLTDKAVERLKVSFNSNPVRDLDVFEPGLFTMGYAGIKLANAENLREFGVRAYDEFGRFLNTEHFKVNYINNTTVQDQIKISNYITKRAGDFGKTYTLYELMAKPKIFENILSSLSVDNLNSLGITYAKQFSTVNVSNFDQLSMALANSNIKTINITEDLSLTSELIIPHSLTINGKKADGSVAKMIGDLTLGQGSDITVYLNNLEVTGELKVDVGAGGNVYADNVTSGSTNIVSGNKNSIHLNKFNTNSLTFTNTSPVRVVLTNSTLIDVELKEGKEVILEGRYGHVISTHDDSKLTLKTASSINRLTVNGAKLTVTHPNTIDLPANNGTGKLEVIKTDETEPGGGETGVDYLGKTVTLYMVQNSQVNLEGNINLSGIDRIAQEIEKWRVEDPGIFGSGTVSVSEGKLYIKNLAILTEEKINRDVTLIGMLNEKEYKLVVPVEISN